MPTGLYTREQECFIIWYAGLTYLTNNVIAAIFSKEFYKVSSSSIEFAIKSLATHPEYRDFRFEIEDASEWMHPEYFRYTCDIFIEEIPGFPGSLRSWRYRLRHEPQAIFFV
jgi:hypothetical protein